MSKMFSALVGLFMLGLTGAASAAEPMALTEAQMDEVTAGNFVIVPLNLTNLNVQGIQNQNNQQVNSNTFTVNPVLYTRPAG